METINPILEKEKFIYDSMNRTGLYDCLFALLLYKITDICWARYFMKQFSFMKDNSIVTTNYKGSCYYDGKMEINYSEASLNSGVIPHEFGHFVFDKMLDKKEEDIITNFFKKEVSHFIKDEEYLIKLHQKYCSSATWREICNSRKYCPIMITDGVSILKRKKWSQGLNHGSDYPINHLASELFAEVLEAEVLGYQIPLTIYKEECPKTYSYIRNKIYDILKP